MLACGKPGMLACWKLGLLPPPPPLLLLLLLLLGPLGPCSPGAPAAAAPADDAAKLEFSTERPLHLVSPAFLSFTIDANLATDPRFFTFLGTLSGYAVHFCQLLRTELDLWSKCITTNCRYALGQFQRSVTPGLLLFQEL
uniref:Heparanase n=1 Tax=Ovis aries TaxID=9940 RepID=A0AC11DPJ8_SHEEP